MVSPLFLAHKHRSHPVSWKCVREYIRTDLIKHSYPVNRLFMESAAQHNVMFILILFLWCTMVAKLLSSFFFFLQITSHFWIWLSTRRSSTDTLSFYNDNLINMRGALFLCYKIKIKRFCFFEEISFCAGQTNDWNENLLNLRMDSTILTQARMAKVFFWL